MSKVHIMTPYSMDKNLGKAYNECMSMISEDDWACLMDYDAMLLTADAGRILQQYTQLYPDALLTCLTNRVHPANKQQLFEGAISSDPDIRSHIRIAEECKQYLYSVTEVSQHLSGYLMLISKRMWNEIKFTEEMKCLGVDTDFFKKLKEAGKEVLCMSGLYVWHSYRLMTDVKDKSHLL